MRDCWLNDTEMSKLGEMLLKATTTAIVGNHCDECGYESWLTDDTMYKCWLRHKEVHLHQSPDCSLAKENRISRWCANADGYRSHAPIAASPTFKGTVEGKWGVFFLDAYNKYLFLAKRWNNR